VPEILSRAHDSPLSSHCGIHKTIERVRRYYFWPGLVSDIKTYINACEVCKTTKAPNFVLRPPLGKAPESQGFFQRLFIDFLGPYPTSRSGNIGIFIVLNHFSKYVFLKAVRRIETSVVIKYIWRMELRKRCCPTTARNFALMLFRSLCNSTVLLTH